jgi:NNP family nitrate/nitrite transporter-like MFS transporter
MDSGNQFTSPVSMETIEMQSNVSQDQLKNSRQAYINLFLATLAFAVAFTAWSLVSPIAKQLQQALQLDDFQKSALIAMPVILGSLLRIPLGLLTDRFGGRRVFTVLLALTLLPVAFLGIADSFWTYILGGLFLGIAGASFAVGVPFVSRWFTPDKQGLAIGIYGMGNIGTAAALFSMPALVSALGSRQGAFWFYLVPVALMAIVFWLFARDAHGLVQPKSLSDSLSVLRAEKMAWILSLFYFLTFGGFVAISNYLPTLTQEWFKLSPTDAGLRAAGFTLVATLARPLGGWLSDKLGGKTVLTWVFVLGPIGALALAWLASNPRIEFATVIFLVTAAGMGLGNGAIFKLVAQYFPKNTGLITGIAGCAGGLGGFFPPLVLGLVKGATGTYVLGFILLAAFAALCFFVLFRMQRSPAPTTVPAP